MRAHDFIPDTLNEGLSPVVYHATSFKAAGSMLELNMMRSKSGALSFTRSLQGAYHKVNRLIGIIFELDGRKLNMNYKGGSIGTEYYDYENDDELIYKGKDNKQLEDRLYTGEIKDLKKYIKSAIIYVPVEYLERDTDEFGDYSYSTQLLDAPNVIALLEQNNIPHRYVTSEKELVDPRVNNKKLFKSLVSKYDYK
jgi:hypothetical protein